MPTTAKTVLRPTTEPPTVVEPRYSAGTYSWTIGEPDETTPGREPAAGNDGGNVAFPKLTKYGVMVIIGDGAGSPVGETENMAMVPIPPDKVMSP